MSVNFLPHPMHARLVQMLQNVCKTLWCYSSGYKCETKHLPAAEGTSCGYRKVISIKYVNICDSGHFYIALETERFECRPKVIY